MKTDNQKYVTAKKRVEAIRGFYSHLTVYIIVNLFILIASGEVFRIFGTNGGNVEFDSWLSWNIFGTPLFWGIGLFFHGLYVFGPKIRFMKNWEERKIKEYMDRES